MTMLIMGLYWIVQFLALRCWSMFYLLLWVFICHKQ